MAVKFTEKYFTTAEAGTEIGVTADTVKCYCNTGRIKGEKIGNNWMIPQSEIKRYLKDESDRGRPKNVNRSGQ